MKTLYQQAIEAGIPYNNHCSDLYLPVNDATKVMIAEYEFKSNVTTFMSEIDGKRWYDVPFAYDPFWAKCDEMCDVTFFQEVQ